MKKVHLILFLVLAFPFFWACDKENGDGGNTGSTPDPIEWDGIKRGNVYYEIFVRSFADANGDGIGDLKGITDKLDYLHSLGIRGIWLTPIHPSPSYHGYDVNNYKTIHPQFGTMADFDALITKANNLNIKVVLDWVVNHTCKEHQWFVQACSSTSSPYRDFYLFAPSNQVQAYVQSGQVPSTTYYNAYEWHNVESGTTDYKYFGAFSSWMPDINPTSAVVDSLYEAAKMWLDKGVSGFRFDAVKHIYQVERSQDNLNFWQNFLGKLKSYKPDVYLVGEMFDNKDGMAYFYQAFPALFNFPNWNNLEWALNNNTGKYYPKDVAECMSAFVAANPDYINVPKLSNHDEDRTMSVLNYNVNKAKIAAAVLLTMPGQPYLYYGEEIGMRGLKQTGDENVREPFLWAPKAGDGYRTSWRTPMFNTDDQVTSLSVQQADKNSLYSVYAAFIKLRNSYPALAEGSFAYPDPSDMPNELMVYTRQKDNQRVLVIHNLGVVPRVYRINEQVKRILAVINAAILEKAGDAYNVKLPSYSSIVLEY
ncbi:MAG: alpha-amylase family glycosyl hydrolase [Bacteroidales bacterium]|nr:alpha-amylase family glycosyl hydrolase [Bacteroidales bacterium]MCL2133119.1 alpha-amylase family glycosyl hydrolase [Bacteroidales bacterium]